MATRSPSNEPNNLAVSLRGVLFHRTDYEKLVNVLADCERTTDSWMIDSEDQLVLSRKAITAGGDRISWLAMRQICKALSAGLASSLADLLGMRRASDAMDKLSKIKADPDEDFTVGEAASLYNLVLKKRFGRLFGFQAIRNSETRVIEALVGNRYRRLSNSDFLSAVSSVMGSCSVRLSFFSAELSGRRLSLVYSMDDHGDEGLRPGIRLVNSEIGDSAIKAAVVLIDKNGATMQSSYGRMGRVAHSGRDLLGKLSKLIVGVVSKLENKTFSKESLVSKQSDAQARLLGFTGEENDESRFSHLVEFLSDRGGLTYFMSRRCLSMVLTGDEPASNNFLMLDRSKNWPSRSAMDLVRSIAMESLEQRSLNFLHTDKYERVAWNLFFNRLVLPDSVSGE